MGTVKIMTTPEIQTFGGIDLFSLLPQLHLLFSSIICTDFLAILNTAGSWRCTRLQVNTAPPHLDSNA